MPRLTLTETMAFIRDNELMDPGLFEALEDMVEEYYEEAADYIMNRYMKLHLEDTDGED